MEKEPFSIFHLTREKRERRQQVMGQSASVGRYRRHPFRFIDHAIQMRMLVSLLIMEGILVTSGVLFLYFRFKGIIEENFYRIHMPQQHSMIPDLLLEVGVTVGVLVLVNLLAVVVADRLWVRYVGRVLAEFSELAERTANFDLRPDPRRPPPHEVVDLMLTWRRAERERALEVRAMVRRLDGAADFTDPDTREKHVKLLKRLREILPPYSRRHLWRPIGKPAEEESEIKIRMPHLPKELSKRISRPPEAPKAPPSGE